MTRFSAPRLGWMLGCMALVGLVVTSPPASVAATPDAASRPTTHTVKRGESLRSVADLYECTITEIFIANRDTVRHPHMLGVGVELTIPVCEPPVQDVENVDTPAADMRPGPQHCGWTSDMVDGELLKTRLREQDVKLPDFLQAIVVETTASGKGDHIAQQRVFSVGPVTRAEGWHPGLTANLFAAIGSLERMTQLGLHGDVDITFRDDAGPRETTLGSLLNEALGKGKSHAHNRLVQLAGSDRLHGESGSLSRHGFDGTTLKLAFDAASWADAGHARGLRRAPAVWIKRESKGVELPATVGERVERCDQEACTSITDLARAMCLITQHARLPMSRRLELGQGDTPANLALLKGTLQRSKRQTPGHVEYVFMHNLTRHRGYQIYRRADRHGGWSTAVFGVTSSKSRREYVIAMTAHGKRRPLVDVAEVIAELLKAEDL